MNYYKVIFNFYPLHPWTEILLAFLADIDFESFEENDNGLVGYIAQHIFNQQKVDNICQRLDIKISTQTLLIKSQNWNAKWESDFNPILIDQVCGIRADFHSPLNVQHEIIITPKMSFGTGHHATTEGMIRCMLSLDFNQKKVLDMGCGTAVLAILSEKLGSNNILAIDIEEWAFTNAKENIEKNQCQHINLKLGGAEQIEGNFDVILANINRNILLQDIPIYFKHLNSNGLLLISGFYEQDLDLILEKTKPYLLNYITHTTLNKWVTAQFKKS